MKLVNEFPHALHLSDFLGEPYFVKNTPFFIEQPVFRYRANTEYALQEIRDSCVHLSPASAFNDPFDSTYHVSDEALLNGLHFETHLQHIVEMFFPRVELLPALSSEETKQMMSITDFMDKRFPQSLSTSIRERIVSRLLTQVQSAPRGHYPELKIACFSEVNDSIPMWSYYAANHTGICLKYDFPALDGNVEDEKSLQEALTKVHYSNFQPQDLHGTYSYTVKSVQWAHEQEWRLICKTDDKYICVPCLSAVYLGLRFDLTRINELVEAIKSTGREIELYAAQVDPKKYAIKFLPLTI